MPKKEVIQVNLAAANPNLSPATRFGDLVFVAGQTGRHPITGKKATVRLTRSTVSLRSSRLE